MKTEPTINIQSEVIKIHAQYGMTEMANYHIEKLFEKYVEQSSPKIKQLEWVEVYRSIFNADTSFKYAYEIHVNDDYSTILFDSSGRKPKRFINLKDAKSSAQADFEKRVMECLDL